jgi:hypothetical protein
MGFSPHEAVHEGWSISDDPARFDLARAHGWIANESYWAQDISLVVFARALGSVLNKGLAVQSQF